MNKQEVKNLQAGDQVFWRDPDGGHCSRIYTISDIGIKGDIVSIVDKDGAHLECFVHELCEEPMENPRWLDNSIQFPRLIAEMEACGAFTPKVMRNLSAETDLPTASISELVDRAQRVWERVKANLKREQDAR